MSYQEDLILSIYGRGEPGLAMGNEIPPGKGGSPGQPYDPPKPTGPYVPAPSRNLATLADREPSSFDMNYVTEKGFFLDGSGDAYMQGGGKFQNAGEYDIEIHGLPVPLAQQMQINPDVAMDYDPGDMGGVVIPQDFSPVPFRNFDHIRTPAIRQKELFHFNNFIESMGGGLDKVQNPNSMMISQIGVGAPHTNVRIDTGEDGYGKPYKRVLPEHGGSRIGNIRLKKT